MFWSWNGCGLKYIRISSEMEKDVFGNKKECFLRYIRIWFEIELDMVWNRVGYGLK